MKLTSEGKIIGSIYNDPMRRNPNLHLRFYNRNKRQVFQLLVTNYLDVLTAPTEPMLCMLKQIIMIQKVNIQKSTTLKSHLMVDLKI